MRDIHRRPQDQPSIHVAKRYLPSWAEMYESLVFMIYSKCPYISAPPFLLPLPCFFVFRRSDLGGCSRCDNNNNNTLQQQHQRLVAVLVQVPTIFCICMMLAAEVALPLVRFGCFLLFYVLPGSSQLPVKESLPCLLYTSPSPRD